MAVLFFQVVSRDADLLDDRQQIFRDRSRQQHRLAGGRMLNRKRLCVQTDARDDAAKRGVLFQAAVQGIADKRMAQCSGVNADLMCAAGMRECAQAA